MSKRKPTAPQPLPPKLTNASVTTMLCEALLALASAHHSPRNPEHACQLLRNVSLAVAGGAEPDIAAVARLLGELLPDVESLPEGERDGG